MYSGSKIEVIDGVVRYRLIKRRRATTIPHEPSLWYRTGAGSGERRDCAVRAATIAAGREYVEVHRIFWSYGRKPRRSTPLRIFMQVAEHLGAVETLAAAGYRVGPLGTGEKSPTLSRFAATHREGRYVVRVRGHMLAVIDGVVHDHSQQPRRRVLQAWRFDS